MASYKLIFKPSALKELKRLPTKKDRQRILEKIEALQINPRPDNCKKLAGAELYRMRQGNFRIIYEIRDQQLIIYIIKIGNRKDVYRK